MVEGEEEEVGLKIDRGDLDVRRTLKTMFGNKTVFMANELTTVLCKSHQRLDDDQKMDNNWPCQENQGGRSLGLDGSCGCSLQP